MFIDRLRPQTKQLLYAYAGGKIKLKTLEKATELIENMLNQTNVKNTILIIDGSNSNNV